MNETNEQITLLVRRGKAGDAASMEQLASAVRGDLFRMVYYRTRSKMDADDLTQEILMTMIARLETLREPERFRAWLFRIAMNRVRDFQRRKRFSSLFRSGDDDDGVNILDREVSPTEGPGEHLDRKEFWGVVRGFLSTLSRWEKEVFLLHFLDGLTIRETAEVIGRKESTVKTHLYRAVGKFKNNTHVVQAIGGNAR